MSARVAIEAQPAEVPPFIDDPSALVIVDWSSWIHRAWAVSDVGMMSHVVGWLCALLAHRPAHVVIALDAMPPTRRHEVAHPTDPEWRYKGDRPAKPEAFYAISARVTEIAELHAIPCLWAERSEADDVIATITARARALGYRVWIATSDKDLHGLCEEDARSGIVVGTWDRFERTYRGPAEVRAKWGVEPAQMADLLAIAGDSSDGIPGVDGLGLDRGAKILRACGTLEAALARDPADGASLDIEIRALDKGRAEAKKNGENMAPITAEIRRLRAMMPAAWKTLSAAAQAMERDIVRLHRETEIARFSRDLTALDCDVGISIPWANLPVGGFDMGELRRRYAELGYTRKADQIPRWNKRGAWALPFDNI